MLRAWPIDLLLVASWALKSQATLCVPGSNYFISLNFVVELEKAGRSSGSIKEDLWLSWNARPTIPWQAEKNRLVNI